MSKDIKDYLHFHLGCNWQWTQYAGRYDSGIYSTGLYSSKLLREVDLKRGVAKPILRPLDDMTEDEAYQILSKQHIYIVIPANHEMETDRFISYRLQINKRKSKIKFAFFPVVPTSAEAVRYCLENGFDLFNLIPEGLAIDKTKVK